MDMILRAEGDSADHYKLAKQADTLMLFYLFSDRELKELFTRLGYEYKADTMQKNIEYYHKRCSHCSTLSLIVHAAIMGNIDPERSWKMFIDALHADIVDVQGGTTQEGIHMAIMAGTLDLVQRGFMGMEIDGDGALRFQPKPIAALDGLAFRMMYRDTPLRIELSKGVLHVGIGEGETGQPVKVCVGNVSHVIKVGETQKFPLDYMKTARTAA
jgi:trehalose/maltose hydrolase-like predicted phosphorylase